MPSGHTQAKPETAGLKEAVAPFVQDIATLTNRSAFAELTDRWPDIWAVAKPLGATKSEAWKAAWMQFKAARRIARAARLQEAPSDVSDSVAQISRFSDVSDGLEQK